MSAIEMSMSFFNDGVGELTIRDVKTGVEASIETSQEFSEDQILFLLDAFPCCSYAKYELVEG